MKAIIEGLLFVSGNEGLSLHEIAEITEKDEFEIKETIKELYKDYQSTDRGIQIELLGNKFKLTTKQEHKDYYQKMTIEEANSTLSQSALETLAIIAYNEPITRIEIDEIRGVNSSYVLRRLLLKDLIVEVGRSSMAGRPKQYGVTSKFLDYFGLGSIDELPKLEKDENSEFEEETNLFKSKYTEEVDN